MAPAEIDERARPQADEYTRRVPEATLEILARSLQKEGARYGFSKLDFIRFVNVLLDIAVKDPTVPDRQPVVVENGATAIGPDPGASPCPQKRVKLRRFVPEVDGHLMTRWMDDPHGRYFRLCCATARYNSCEELLEHNSEHMAIICLLDETPIGAIAYLEYDPVQGRAELRKVIGERGARGHGYAREATQLWIEYGFNVLGLRKIYLHTLDTALRNIRLNESVGFVVEGILRNEIVLDGQVRDVLRMGLCR